MKFLEEIFRIARPEEDEEDDFEEFDSLASRTGERAERTEHTERKSSTRLPGNRERERERENDFVSSGRQKRDFSKMRNNIVDITTHTNTKVVVMEPKKYSSEVKTIAEFLRKKHTIFLNLEQTDEVDSCRILDFLAGVAYAVDGNVRKIATATYVITPFTVTLLDSLMDGLEKEGIFYKDENEGIF